MKAILMSIKPKWCEKIFSGKMTIKVCKTAFKLETPFKVYVYCTKERMTRVPSLSAYLHKNEPKVCAEYGTIETWSEIGDVIVNPHLASKHVSFGMHGKVVGEFVFDEVDEYTFSDYEACYRINDVDLTKTCLNHPELIEYGGGKTLHGMHITEPKIYDTPRELGEFKTPEKWSHMVVKHDNSLTFIDGYVGGEPLKRAPSSWCYVEEVVE